jgi:hypothetical protein
MTIGLEILPYTLAVYLKHDSAEMVMAAQIQTTRPKARNAALRSVYDAIAIEMTFPNV